jgi:hypothetical protein
MPRITKSEWEYRSEWVIALCLRRAVQKQNDRDVNSHDLHAQSAKLIERDEWIKRTSHVNEYDRFDEYITPVCGNPLCSGMGSIARHSERLFLEWRAGRESRKGSGAENSRASPSKC